MAHAHACDLPDVTDAHRRAAFEAMRWTGWTFEAAMADDTRRRVIEARAHQVRTQQWKATRRTVIRHMASTGDQHPIKGRPGQRFWPIDLKRAAAGDLDD